jgi:transposase-like protein
MIGVDLIGPLKETANGKKYIMTVTDYYSKWVDAKALRDKSSSGVIAFLKKLMRQHGSPNVMITDQGKEFNNQVCT